MSNSKLPNHPPFPAPDPVALAQGPTPANIPKPEPPGSAISTERRALTWLALVAVVGILWVALPVGVGVLLGVLMASSAQPFFEWLRRKSGRTRLAAFTMVVASAFGIVAVARRARVPLRHEGVLLAKQFVEVVSAPSASEGIMRGLARPLAMFGFSHTLLLEHVRTSVASLAADAAVWAEHLVAATASALLALFFAVLTMDLVLPRWAQISVRAQRVLPIRPEYTRGLFDEFRKIGRATLLGTVVTGMAQGTFATVGYFAVGVPDALFLVPGPRSRRWCPPSAR